MGDERIRRGGLRIPLEQRGCTRPQSDASWVHSLPHYRQFDIVLRGYDGAFPTGGYQSTWRLWRSDKHSSTNPLRSKVYCSWWGRREGRKMSTTKPMQARSRSFFIARVFFVNAGLPVNATG